MQITYHALARFSERCLGMDLPDDSSARGVMNRMLPLAIGKSVHTGKPMIWDLWPVVMDGDRVLTILPEGGRPMKRGKAERRRLARTAC